MPGVEDRSLADRYRIERELGAGGMATVYLAEDLKHHRKVAIKVLHAELSAILGSERFLKEIELTASLQHPHILPLFDSGLANGFLYYVMPYVDGETLRSRLERERQLPVQDAVRIATEVADALQNAHELGVAHRDIKPENILLQHGHALVADFGIALAVQQAGGARMTQTGLSLGTPQYMSPEQAMGERAIDARTDIYSLGAVTYEMLTGEAPFTGPNAQAIVAQVLTTEAPLASAHRRSVPEHIDAAVSVALAKLPADRFANARDLAGALNGTSPAPSVGHRRGAPAAAGRLRRAHRLAAAASALAAAFAVVAVAALVAWRRASSAAPPGEVTRFSVAIPRPSDNSLYSVGIAVAHRGRMLAYVDQSLARVGGSVDHAASGKGGIYLRRFDRAEATLLPGTADAQVVVFSPDGKSLAFATSSRYLRVIPIGGGASVPIANDVSWPDGVDWGDDGYIYFVSGDSGVVMRVPATGGASERVAPLEQSSLALGFRAHHVPHVLLHGKAVTFSVFRGAGRDGDIFITDLRSGTTKPLVKGVCALGVDRGRLLFIGMGGTLEAIPFDEQTLTVHGSAQPLLTGIQTGESKAEAAFGGGTLVYVPSVAPASQLVWVSREGVETPLGAPLDIAVGNVAISPRGDRVALSTAVAEQGGSGAIWLYDIANQTLSRFTDEGSINYRPEWSPDGASIVFSSDRGSTTGVKSLWIEPADGRDTARVLVRSPRHAQEVSWVAASPWVVYRVGYDDLRTFRDLRYLKPGSDTTTHSFLATRADELNPALAPNGRWLAYTSNESGQGEVYVAAFPGPGPRTQVSAGGGTGPLWSPDGRALYYRALDGRFMAVDVASGNRFSMSHRRALFSASSYASYWTHHAYDIAPDGRFLFIKLPGEPEIRVILHWSDEVATRLERDRRAE